LLTYQHIARGGGIQAAGVRPLEAREIEAVWLTTWICYEHLFEEPYEETVGAALLGRWPKV